MMGQVVIQPAQSGASELRILPMPNYQSFEPAVGNALKLGSQDLIRLAIFAKNSGHRVTGFMIADRELYRLTTDEEREISDRLVELLNTYGGEEVAAALRDEYRGLYIIGIDIVQRETLTRLSIRRQGIIRTSTESIARSFLQNAWEKLSLT